ncbi:hypothetical protein [Roseivivax isoporae]|uniref:Uncharacterized protein n=1 Tax=Roseivivax isoporae LMG 25204 TaxID=1449351 RepID=X7F3C8_9RHOB|nr:hypothetical protein [Roseivivax isoporae]ETX26586.1 hypothetical protein RISW2_21840 [Roseivivax isoporae LMG 25204]
MADVRPLAVKDTTAAAMLDMPAAEFRRLVALGVMPRPRKVGPHDRWRTSDIQAIIDGDTAWPDDEDIEA